MELKKELTLYDVFCLVSGTMISSGIFVLPAIIYVYSGPAIVFAYLLAGLITVPGMISQAELVSAMPKTGGTYFYVTRSMGDAVGTINGIMTWCSLSLKTAFAIIGMAALAQVYISFDIHIIALILTALFVWINLIGVKEVGRLQRVIVTILLFIMLMYIGAGATYMDVHNLVPFNHGSLVDLFKSAAMVFVSFGGLLKICSVAEEVKDAQVTIPRGMISALVIVTLIYAAIALVTSGILHSSIFSQSLTPLSTAANIMGGNVFSGILSIAALIAFVSTANAGILAASRYPYALSKDNLLPSSLSFVHSRFKTPVVAILLTGMWIGLAVCFDITFLVKMASAVIILTFMFSCLAIIIMRESLLQNYKPQFKAAMYPYIQIVGIVIYAAMILSMGAVTVWALALFLATGLFVYWFYGRIRSNREFALLHLVERITAKELTSRSLESELKEIIRERDELPRDRFDELVENAIIIDLDKSFELTEFFKRVSAELSNNIKVDKRVIFKLLCAREMDTSTVIGPGVAVPHIILEGCNIFELLIVRAKKGINFPEAEEEVRTVFVLAGTADERNFHLRSLAAIAQILQSKGFEERWLKAKNTEALRDLILLAKRRR